MKLLLLRKLYLLVTVAVFLMSVKIVVAADPGITITSPPQGTIVEPGSMVHIVVGVDPVLNPMSVEVTADIMSGLGYKEDLTAPYEFDFTLPLQHTGPFSFDVVVKDGAGNIFNGPNVELDIKPSGVPNELRPGTNIILKHIPQGVDPASLSAGKVSVYGIFADGIKRKLSYPGYGVTYTSSNTGVVTTDENGVLTPVSTGIAYIIATYKGLKAFTQVDITDDNNKFHITEHTDKVSITASGFRKEPLQGLYIQQLTLRNDGTLPIPFPVNVILSDLPPGVSVMGGSGTKTVTPLGSRSLDVEINHKHFWLPGKTATVSLEFSNDDGRPITYTARIFTALIP